MSGSSVGIGPPAVLGGPWGGFLHETRRWRGDPVASSNPAHGVVLPNMLGPKTPSAANVGVFRIRAYVVVFFFLCVAPVLLIRCFVRSGGVSRPGRPLVVREAGPDDAVWGGSPGPIARVCMGGTPLFS